MCDKMFYNYISLIFFILFAVFIPFSFLMTSKLLRKRDSPNKVKCAPYESGEETIGRNKDLEVEYFPFLMLFLPFEIITILILLWSIAASNISYINSIEILSLTIISLVFSLFGYKLISDRNDR